MSDWKSLEKELGNWLAGFASDVLCFRKRFPEGGFSSDGMLTDGRILVAVEIEAGQTHPDTNVAKYWWLQEKHRAYDKIILFHVYTPAFNRFEGRKRLGEFLVDKMKEQGIPIEYVPCDYREANSYSAVVSGLREAIERKISEEFGSARRG